MWVNKDYGDVSQLSSSTNIKELNSNSLTNLSNKRIGDVPVLLATDLLEPATRPVGEPSLISLEGIPSVRQVGTIKQKALTGYNEIRGYH